MINAKEAKAYATRLSNLKKKSEKKQLAIESKVNQKYRKEIRSQLITILKNVEIQIKDDIKEGDDESSYYCGEDRILAEEIEKALVKNGYFVKTEYYQELDSDGCCSVSPAQYTLIIKWQEEKEEEE